MVLSTSRRRDIEFRIKMILEELEQEDVDEQFIRNNLSAAADVLTHTWTRRAL